MNAFPRLTLRHTSESIMGQVRAAMQGMPSASLTAAAAAPAGQPAEQAAGAT